MEVCGGIAKWPNATALRAVVLTDSGVRIPIPPSFTERRDERSEGSVDLKNFEWLYADRGIFDADAGERGE